MSVLSDIFGSELQKFYDVHEKREPYLFKCNDPNRFQDLFPFRAADEILASDLVPPALLKVVRAGSVVNKSAYVCKVPIGYGYSEVVDPDKIRQAWDEGHTIVLQGVQTFWPSVKRFTRDLEEELTHPTQTNIYITPPDERGSEQHYDTHDVLALQVEGSKEWEMGPFSYREPLAGDSYKLGMGTDTYEYTSTMEPGDCMYIPRGYLHRAKAGSRASLHITIGILVRTYVDILDDLIREAAKDERFRRSLPLGFARNRSQGAAAVEEVIGTLSEWLRELKPKTLMDKELELLSSLRRVPDVSQVLTYEPQPV